MKKRIIIISSILIVLFAAGFITIQIIYGTINYFSKTVESSFNLSLKNIKKKSEDFKLTYNDFKCSGKRSIECYGKKILYDKDRYKIEVKDNKAVILEVNSETDFVAKNEEFTNFVDYLADTIINNDLKTKSHQFTLLCEEYMQKSVN